ncbi:hypothetical protein [Neorhodopirellula lusitana]|uniref:hypothetical protein n=1 Tax=Neorhodopirellula lusitana TaxID=445327 RepID=UPI00384C3A68
MSRRHAGISPSLFPFLAVLICTLGTLILLLALVAQEAKDAAVAKTEQDQAANQKQLAQAEAVPQSAVTLAAPVIDEDPDSSDGSGDAPKLTAKAASRLIDEEQFRLTELVSFRDAQTQNAEEKRNEVAHLEAAIRDLKEKLQELRTEMEAAAGTDEEGQESLDDALRIDDTTLVMMKQEAAKLRGEIAELKENERGQKARVVIVPHRGPNGTQRRPIYVECSEDGIQILPEGVHITQSQALAAAQGQNPNGNPLASALRVARRYAMQNYGDQVAPYPLLVLRPGGIPAYRLATALMKDWDDQYGYELVPGNVDLEFPGGDRVLQKDMEFAVHEASSRNFAVARAAFGRSYQSAGGSGDGDSGGSGTYENSYASSGGLGSGGQAGMSGEGAYAGGASQPKPLPVLSAKSLDSQARSNGFSSAKDQRFANAYGGYQSPPGSQGESYGSNGAMNERAIEEFVRGGRSGGGTEANNDGMSGSTTNALGSTQSAGSDQANSANESAESGDQGEGGSASSAGGAPGGTVASATGTSPSAEQTASSQSAGGQPGSEQGGPESNPGSATPNDQNQQAPAASNLVRREGRDWAMPEAFRGMGGTEVVRPISMVCRHDRYELLEQGRVVTTFPFANQGVHQSTLQLATAVRDRVSRWGATLPGGRWQPRLDVQVGPHAEQRFHELETLMQGSGVEIYRRTQ